MADLNGAGGTRSGLRALIQDHLSDNVVNQLFTRMPWVAMLLMKDGNKKGVYGLGVPSTKSVFSGIPIEKPRREDIFRTGQYMPVIQATKRATSDNKMMGQRDTLPSVSDATTVGPHTYFERPYFRWTEQATPLHVWNKDRDRVAGGGRSRAEQREGITDLWTVESKTQLGNHLTTWNDQLWTADGAPTSQTAEVWDALFSFSAVCDTDNTYGGKDRALAANAYWKGNRITTATAGVITDLFDYAEMDLGIGDKTAQPTLLMTVGANLWKSFKAQARSQGYTMIANGLPEMGELGFKKSLIKYDDNKYIMYDPSCPSVIAGDAKNVAFLATLDSWVVAFNPNKKFAVSEPTDQSDIPGAQDATTANLRTELILACEAPNRQVWWEDVTAV